MTRLLRALTDWASHRQYRKIQRLMVGLYPDAQERAFAYLAEGAETMEAAMFGQGETIGEVLITPDLEEGYEIIVQAAGEYEIEL